jgi:hypothetical protein
VPGEVGVPHGQGGQVAAARADLPRQVRGAQQRVSLLDDAFVVGPHAGVARLSGDEQVIEVPASFGRIALNDLQVLRREQHQPQRADNVAGAPHR